MLYPQKHKRILMYASYLQFLSHQYLMLKTVTSKTIVAPMIAHVMIAAISPDESTPVGTAGGEVGGTRICISGELKPAAS